MSHRVVVVMQLLFPTASNVGRTVHAAVCMLLDGLIWPEEEEDCCRIVGADTHLLAVPPPPPSLGSFYKRVVYISTLREKCFFLFLAL